MSASAAQKIIFKNGSTTYFTSSMFFPPAVQMDVYALYGFVRVADNFVDAVPQDAAGFAGFRARYEAAVASGESDDPIIASYLELARRRRFDPAWTVAFLDAMEADLSRAEYDSVEDVLGYVYGSAEVIGLFMARILDLPEKSLHHARLLGRAMQYINFIRDINEDLALGRRYLPLAGTGLAQLDPEHAASHPREFQQFIDYHLGLWRGWQQEASKGFAMIPRRYRVAIQTASDMYAWTARRIQRDPGIVFRRKVKPRKSRIVLQALGRVIAG